MRKVSQVVGEYIKDAEGGIHKYTLPVTFQTRIPSTPNMEAVCSSKPRYPRTNYMVFHFTGHNKSKRASLATVTVYKVANSVSKKSHDAVVQAQKMVAVF